jgi:hypothetical protein
MESVILLFLLSLLIRKDSLVWHNKEKKVDYLPHPPIQTKNIQKGGKMELGRTSSALYVSISKGL